MTVLDTDVVLDFTHNREPGKSLFLEASKQGSAISVITWIEVFYGIYKRSTKPRKRKQEFLDILKNFSIEILPLNELVGAGFVEAKVSLEKKGKKLTDFDLMVAATALGYKLPLATRNKKHFKRVPKLKLY